MSEGERRSERGERGGEMESVMLLESRGWLLNKGGESGTDSVAGSVGSSWQSTSVAGAKLLENRDQRSTWEDVDSVAVVDLFPVDLAFSVELVGQVPVGLGLLCNEELRGFHRNLARSRRIVGLCGWTSRSIRSSCEVCIGLWLVRGLDRWTLRCFRSWRTS